MDFREVRGNMKTINILGTDYTIEYRHEKDDVRLEDCNGYCETYSKKLIVKIYEDDVQNCEKIELLSDKTLRHEVIHAFLYESGLSVSSEWATNETIVDWIALQLPKMIGVCNELSITE